MRPAIISVGSPAAADCNRAASLAATVRAEQPPFGSGFQTSVDVSLGVRF